MGSFFKTISNLLFPPRCAACRELLPYYSDDLLCDECAEKWKEEISSRCAVCKRLVSECSCVHDNCKRTVSALLSVSAYTSSDSVTDRLVLAAKDHKDKKLFGFMSDKMTEIAYGALPGVGDLLVTFVPRSASRKRETGHDQSEILAGLIADNFSAEMVPLFKKKGRKQQKSLHARDREMNAKRSYVLIKDAARTVNGRIVLLCDDVVTTGASLSACAEMLREAGAERIYALTFAKTVKKSRPKNKKYRKISKTKESD